MISKKAAKRRINTPIRTVVPQPGNTLPASEFKGRNKVPKGVTIPGSCKEESEERGVNFVLAVAILKRIKICKIFYFL
jgi:hypothetical protein